MPRFAAFPLLLAMAACTVGPSYAPPDAKAPQDWLQDAPGAVPVAAASAWWEEFHDPALDRLVRRAMANSIDVRRASAIVEEARAAVAQAKAGGMPQLGGSVSGFAGRVYSNAYISERYGSAGFDASWEIDLWGKVRRSVEGAKANQDAAEAGVDDARLTVLGEVARDYIQIRASESRIATIRASVEARRKSQAAVQLRLDAGDGTRLEVLQAESSVIEAGTGIAALESDIMVSTNALAILCGVGPSEMEPVGGSFGKLPQAAPPSLGVPADLVRRRPDVRVAERQLAQAVAQIGVAKAARYPSLSINGTIGLSGMNLAAILAQPVFSLAPRIALPLVDGGRISADIQAAEAKAEEARLGYRAAVLKAVQEVEDAMARLQGARQTAETQRRLVSAAEKQVAVAKQMFQIGGDSFLPVLDAQRGIDSARLALAQSEADQAVLTVALYKALGGGWGVR